MRMTRDYPEYGEAQGCGPCIPVGCWAGSQGGAARCMLAGETFRSLVCAWSYGLLLLRTSPYSGSRQWSYHRRALPCNYSRWPCGDPRL